MAKIIELGTSRKRRGGNEPKSLEMRFRVQGPHFGPDVLALVLSRAPFQADTNLWRDDDNIVVEPVEADVWEASVPYKPREEPEEKPSQSVEEDYTSIEFDGLAGSEHATQCIEQTDYGPVSGRDIKDTLVVGLRKDGVEGYERQVAKFHFIVNIRLKGITPAHVAMLAEMTDETPVNNAPFFGFGAGEVLFKGARGRIPKKSTSPRELGLHFAVSRTRKNLKVGQEITIPEKPGWDYLWVMYKKAVLSDRMVDVPDVAFVSKIYERGDFSRLNHLFNPNYSG